MKQRLDVSMGGLIGALCLALAGVSVACSSDDGTPGNGGTPANGVDGTWLVTELSCDSQKIPVGEFTLDVNGDQGTFIQKFGPGCVLTYDEAYVYPSKSSIEIAPKTITCGPNDSCQATLGTSCPPLPGKTAFDYSRSGDTLTFSRTAEGPGDAPCQPGQKVQFVMKKQ